MRKTEAPHLYGKEFFANHLEGALRSARFVAPVLCEFVKPRSVVDFGCGWGAWLKAFEELGVREVKGIDGDYVDRSRLLFDARCFQPADLGGPIYLDRRYDLALCLEVAEHLPPERAAGLVADLVKSAQVVMFSAAIPGQSGLGHVNQRWPSYWAGLFEQHGYRLIDALRPRLRHEPGVAFFYRQNLVLYVESKALRQNPVLAAIAEQQAGRSEEWVYGPLYRSALAALEGPIPMRRLIRELPSALIRVVRRTVEKFFRSSHMRRALVVTNEQVSGQSHAPTAAKRANSAGLYRSG